MARAGSAWSVKGIDEETRSIARLRAGDSDLTIGAWIDRVILDYSSAPNTIAAKDKEAQPARVPVGTDDKQEPALADQDVLDLIDQELDASRSRLDGALRPVGYALKDLALRLVAAEALERGDTQRLVDPNKSRRQITESNTQPEPGAIETTAPPAPLGSLAPEISDTEIPTPRIVQASQDSASELPPPTDLGPFPSPPTHSLHAPITGLEEPPPGARLNKVPEPDESKFDDKQNAVAVFPTRPAPIPPTSSLSTIDPSDMPNPRGTRAVSSVSVDPDQSEGSGSTPQFGSLSSSPSDPIMSEDATPLAPDPGVRFTGVQGGFESDPDLAHSEARRENRRHLRRLAAGIIPFVIVGSIAAGYIFAEPLGLMPLRVQLTEKLKSHGNQAWKTLSDAYSEGHERLAGWIEGLEQTGDPQPPLIIADVNPTPEVTKPSKAPPSVAAPDIASRPVKKLARIDASDPLKPDDPAVVNLSAMPSSGNQPSPDQVNPKPLPEETPAPMARSIQPRLAQLLPPPPVIPGPVVPESATNTETPKQIAALPTPPPIKDASIPPSGTNRNIPIAVLTDAARAGDPRSQLELARRYLQGDGIEQDFAEASEWFREAAIQGVANAQYNLAVLYERGLGVTKDDVRALLWYHSAAEQSHPLAQYNLGNFYLQGRGIPLSYGEAVRWFRAASRQGVSKATYNLAVLTEDGLGVPRDKNKALALYEKAAEAGHHEAASRLGLLKNLTGAKTKPATFAETANTQTDELSAGNTVAAIQAVLRGVGVYDGRIDGIAGPKTRTAIREYQKRQDLPITGIPSENLLDHMKATGGSKPLSG